MERNSLLRFQCIWLQITPATKIFRTLRLIPGQRLRMSVWFMQGQTSLAGQVIIAWVATPLIYNHQNCLQTGIKRERNKGRGEGEREREGKQQREGERDEERNKWGRRNSWKKVERWAGEKRKWGGAPLRVTSVQVCILSRTLLNSAKNAEWNRRMEIYWYHSIHERNTLWFPLLHADTGKWTR